MNFVKLTHLKTRENVFVNLDLVQSVMPISDMAVGGSKIAFSESSDYQDDIYVFEKPEQILFSEKVSK